MHLILHDLPPALAARLLPGENEALVHFSAVPSVKPCAGCFGCWTKSPGQCVIPDRGRELCSLLARADKFTIVSRCHYGGFSPDVKAVLDRFIGHVLPWFRIIGGEMHHVPRYGQKITLVWHLYGDNSEAERETALRLAAANARNMHAASHAVHSYASADDLEVRA